MSQPCCFNHLVAPPPMVETCQSPCSPAPPASQTLPLPGLTGGRGSWAPPARGRPACPGCAGTLRASGRRGPGAPPGGSSGSRARGHRTPGAATRRPCCPGRRDRLFTSSSGVQLAHVERDQRRLVLLHSG